MPNHSQDTTDNSNDTAFASGGCKKKSPALMERFVFDCDYLLRFCDKFSNSSEIDQSDSLLEIKLKDLEARWGKVESSYQKVMLAPDSEVNDMFKKTAEANFDNCVDAFYTCNAQIVDMMKSQLDRTQAQHFEALGRGSVCNQAQAVGFGTSTHYPPISQPLSQNVDYSNPNTCIKLPPCDTEIFYGSYEQWPSFRDMFTAVYINHSKLTPVTKLYHLRNKTQGEAGAIVKRFTLSNDNFQHAWDALKTRYENKRVLVDNQIKILFDIPPAKGEDSESIRRIQSSVNDSLATLVSLGIAVESWDPILIRLISTKLPTLTLSLWEQSLTSPRELPKWTQMSQFLVDRYEAVERLNSIKTTKDCFNLTNKPKPHIQTFVSQENLGTRCKLCQGEHLLKICPKFQEFTVQQRIDFVYKNKFCNNCLASSHLKANCKSKHTCLHCNKTHHTMLHMNRKRQSSPHNFSSQLANEPNTISQTNSRNNLHDQCEIHNDQQPQFSGEVQANFSANCENILLRTALVQIQYMSELVTLRALIDPGSQRTFLSESIRSRLQLPYKKSHFEIIGIGGRKQTATKECEFVIYAKKYDLRIPIKAIVLPKVTKQLPAVTFNVPSSSEIYKLDLADPYFNVASHIDLILGNDYEEFINIDGISKNVCGKTSAYNTIFGWVLSGPMSSQPIQALSTTVISAAENSELSVLLRQFWEQEEVPSAPILKQEDEYCEQFYLKSTKRLENGRYMVRLPFKKEFPEEVVLGSSRFIALAQYARMEKTLAKNLELKSQYNDVIKEYLTLDHMEETSSQEVVVNDKYLSFYLPHHAVVRPDHIGTKIRIVFNASRKSKSGFSLNDVLYTGPTLQRDLITVILNWRKYQFVFSTDIQKMYRQILVHPEDRPFQRILFQPEPSGPTKDFQLKTVTFGVNCAPYLAIRTLLQIASDCENTNPRVSYILRNETYVDDILSGGHTIEDAISNQVELIDVLKKSGMPLKKFTANDLKLLSHLTEEDLYEKNFLRFQESSSAKTLGIQWNAIRDSFGYTFSKIPKATTITKRQILSAIAKLFDPAGWLAPIIIKSKLLMQKLWLEGVEWDEAVSTETLQTWNNLVEDISNVDTIHIPRWIHYHTENLVQIHGFCDASKVAYCATVYIRCQTNTHKVYSTLLIAKSKVAPIQTISLPRLELNGAVLLANLVNYILSSLEYHEKELHLWTDSSIVLGWLSKIPSSCETFVANRVSRIHQVVPTAVWHHVPTKDNPADLGTRGCSPSELKSNSLWWHGPSWVVKPKHAWPSVNPLKIIETTVKVQAFKTSVENKDILETFSSYSRALRVISYIFRFFNRTLKRASHMTTALSQREVQFVKTRLLLLSQKRFFNDEYHQLQNSQPVANKSSLKPLNPFIDDNSLLRVNGRLIHSCLPYNERCPIILSGNSRFCRLYLKELHVLLSHADCIQMCRMAQTEFYISRLKPRVKAIIRNCKTCIIHKQTPCCQIMAPLPPERCHLSPPFQVTGLDFAGPFEIKTSALRSSSTIKGYVCVFVCFSTKAVHLEPCSDLSSVAFQAAFSRFVGRRGLPKRVVSDNGRNFLGASRTLLHEFTVFIKSVSSDVAHKYVTHGFEWKFIPPHAPHMGGLWEAAVKCFKHHLKRVAGAQRFNFEEFTTLLARIEGVLNSRPISAFSEDPTDLTALTPGHFLRGAPLMALPEQNIQNISVVNRWEKLKVLYHSFAIRWKEDYLKSLHKRYKWKSTCQNLLKGDLVAVIDDLQPPCEWKLGRIEKTYPGLDSNVRTAEIRTASGIIKRPIVKLCFLPFLRESAE